MRLWKQEAKKNENSNRIGIGDHQVIKGSRCRDPIQSNGSAVGEYNGWNRGGCIMTPKKRDMSNGAKSQKEAKEQVDSPTQTTPLPPKFELQVQIKDPIVLKQVAFESQLSIPNAHSSISAVEN